jgi:hypothetical protein
MQQQCMDEFSKEIVFTEPDSGTRSLSEVEVTFL